MIMASNFSLRLCLLFLIHFGMCFAQLSDKADDERCDDQHLFHIIKFTVWNKSLSEPGLPAALLRLHFHDCFVNGCDGSVLLKSNSTFRGERDAKPNINSLPDLVFRFINDLKTDLNTKCGNQRISCADVLAVAARDAVSLAGGPNWTVDLGRTDSTFGNITVANKEIPAPTLNRSQLIQNFETKNLDPNDLVALSGAHTFGVARCVNYVSRIYDDKADIDRGFAAELRGNCSKSSSTRNGNVTAFLDSTTPRIFDNKYYKNLKSKKGLLPSDQQLFNSDSNDYIDETVRVFANNQDLFFDKFAKAMVKMSNLRPTIHYKTEIRTDCSVVNS